VAWLVTGGAGYIGAHVTSALLRAGEAVVVLDDLSHGRQDRLTGVPFVEGSVLDAPLVAGTLREHDVHGVIHVAAKKNVEESVRRPLHYYRQNVEGLRVLLEAATDAGVSAFVFSSSAAVYGAPNVDVVTEANDCRPVSPYGSTKWIGELMIQEVARATGLGYVSLRCFNVAGANDRLLGDRGMSNLVPLVFHRLANRLPPQIFGGDYETPDGTCVRDFVHVADVASAHLAAARALGEGRVTALTANIGRGEGVSVREMVSTIRHVTGTADQRWAEPVVLPAREGDPAKVVSSARTAHECMGWRAVLGVREMVESAWAAWVSQHELHE
jgi:UDP-glucose 4-epimerase